jgi:hypothetical protein
MTSTKTMLFSHQNATSDGKTLQLSFHAKDDKILDEILIVKMTGWKGIIASFPKNKSVDFLKSFEEAEFSGIYFVLAKNEKKAYIGQAKNEQLKQRLREHNKKRDWWNRCIFVTVADNTLEATDLEIGRAHV